MEKQELLQKNLFKLFDLEAAKSTSTPFQVKKHCQKLIEILCSVEE